LFITKSGRGSRSVAQIVEQGLDLHIARLAQEARRDDLVGVEVGLVDRDRDGSQAGEGFHGDFS
jgi:hypothetical protein